MVFSNSWIIPLKVFFISTGVLSIALFCKISVPFVMDFSVSRAPILWSSLVSWLKPPYLYLIINVIIITVAATSRLCQNDHVSSSTESTPSPLPSDVEYEMKLKSDFANVVYEQQQMQTQRIVREEEEEDENKAPVFEEKSVVLSGDSEVEFGYGDAGRWTPPKRTVSSEILSEEKDKPLVSARFGQRKPVRASAEGGQKLRVTKPKRNETLENTWKTITEGRAMPLTRHLKRSDTLENHGYHINVDLSPVKKSETFKDKTNYQLTPVNNSPGSASEGKLRKEPSLSQDELNRRVEAFIKKFNDEMRLQRQESLRQYKEMISRGV